MEFNIKDEIRKYLRRNKILDLEKSKQLIAVVELVANISWGEGRTIEEAIIIKKVGTCTGKHLVLQACFDVLGINYKPVVCTFRWGNQPIKYPEKLKSILRHGEWEHGHNFVQVIAENKPPIDVDITWNSRLKPYGFKTFPENWDGKTSFVGVDKVIRRWDGADIRDMKKQLIESLSPELRERREQFLKEFIAWVASINNKVR